MTAGGSGGCRKGDGMGRRKPAALCGHSRKDNNKREERERERERV